MDCLKAELVKSPPPARRGFRRKFVYEPPRMPYWQFEEQNTDASIDRMNKEIDIARANDDEDWDTILGYWNGELYSAEWNDQFETWVPAYQEQLSEEVPEGMIQAYDLRALNSIYQNSSSIDREIRNQKLELSRFVFKSMQSCNGDFDSVVKF
jgi:hypothetical protein